MTLKSNPDLVNREWQSIGTLISAHVIALGESGLIGEEGSGVLLRAVETTRSAPAPETGSLLNRIAEFDQRVDAISPAGFTGAANIGRGEIDLAATVVRLILRDEIITIAEPVQQTIAALLEVASAHIVSLMPAYVDGQIAQPTTFAHLLGGVIGPLGRGLDRLSSAYDSVNRSPLGSGSLASTGLSIDRERLAELLGFDGLVDNTLDAVSATDHIVATAEAIAAIISPIRRLLEEIRYWMRSEPGSFTVLTETTSLIGQMPQAKFASGLAENVAELRNIERAVTDLRDLSASVPFGPLTNQLDELNRAIYQITSATTQSLSAFATWIRGGLNVNRALLANRAGKGFSTASDLAEFLMIEEQIDPGSARNIAALTISTARDQGLEAAGITQELIDGAALMVIGQEIKVEFEAISRYIAPRRFIERRTATGAPSPASARAYLEVEQAKLIISAEGWNRVTTRVELARTNLQAIETAGLVSLNE